MVSRVFCSIKWDQKLGGVLEYTYPSFVLKDKDCMNIYQMHRVSAGNKAAAIPNFGNLKIKSESGEYFNVVSFFSGFGGTSPDGFTANYGKETVGISEKVLCLFIPMEAKASDYEEVLARLAARVLLDTKNMENRVKQVGKLVEQSNLIAKPLDLYKFLEQNLDRSLGISKDDLINAFQNEAKALHYMMAEKNATIKDLTINPAGRAYCQDANRIQEAKESRNQLQAMITQITSLSVSSNQKDEQINQLKEDYIKIFGTLTDQILQLENELKGISDSTQALVSDLNVVLAEKIARIQQLEEQIKFIQNN